VTHSNSVCNGKTKTREETKLSTACRSKNADRDGVKSYCAPFDMTYIDRGLSNTVRTQYDAHYDGCMYVLSIVPKLPHNVAFAAVMDGT
jgi:hypothetical protein